MLSQPLPRARSAGRTLTASVKKLKLNRRWSIESTTNEHDLVDEENEFDRVKIKIMFDESRWQLDSCWMIFEIPIFWDIQVSYSII